MKFFVLSCTLTTIFLLFSSNTLQAKEIADDIYAYNEKVGEISASFYWKMEESKQQKIISIHEKGKSFINFCTDDGQTIEWQYIDCDKKHDIIAKRVGNEIKITGVCNGKDCNKTMELDERPWFQPLSYSLRNFLKSDQKTISFWTIRSDTLEVTTMKVEKQGEEDILINENSIPAIKVELRAEGFYSHFWHATYWFRKSDKVFLMYRSVHGPVGTPETIVELMQEPGEAELGSYMLSDEFKRDG